MIEGLSHMTFIVRDLGRMEEIVVSLLGGRRIYDSGDTPFSVGRERFYDVAGLWIAVIEGETLPERSYNHIAFKIRDADFERCLARIGELGLDVLPPRPRVEGEGRSIYFHDHDNHLFELHTGSLSERLARYARGGPAAG
ncbi:MAG: FosX/FosE/FosI family fosfomycin resistance hydrolase [Hyphomicrobiaceae bacterium]|nr:FosX/FosE/FosI family fosfomycin resistance hydrolase [Hyphomicrobiaceae bacterium]